MDDLRDDLMLGAGELAKDVLGKNTKSNRRKIYHMHSLGLLGTFKLNGQIAGRRSTIRQKIAEHEQTAEQIADQARAEREAAQAKV